MKLWFIEPRPNVFVSGIKDSVAETVIEYLFKSCGPNSGLIVFRRTPTTPGFTVAEYGTPRRKTTRRFGPSLVLERDSD